MKIYSCTEDKERNTLVHLLCNDKWIIGSILPRVINFNYFVMRMHLCTSRVRIIPLTPKEYQFFLRPTNTILKFYNLLKHTIIINIPLTFHPYSTIVGFLALGPFSCMKAIPIDVVLGHLFDSMIRSPSYIM